MSFDGRTASTLEIIDSAVPTSRPSARRTRPSATKQDASTVDANLIGQLSTYPDSSSIEPTLTAPPAFVVATDPAEFRVWLERTGGSALLEVVAREFARHMGITSVKAYLETESDEPTEQRVLLLAQVSDREGDALERLFSFTASRWWMSVVRSTQNTLIVDIQHI